MPLDDNDRIRRLLIRFREKHEADPGKYQILHDAYEDTKSDKAAVLIALFSDLCDLCLDLLIMRKLDDFSPRYIQQQKGWTPEEYHGHYDTCWRRYKELARRVFPDAP